MAALVQKKLETLEHLLEVMAQKGFQKETPVGETFWQAPISSDVFPPQPENVDLIGNSPAPFEGEKIGVLKRFR